MQKIKVIQSLPMFVERFGNPYSTANWIFTGRLCRDRFNYLNKYSIFNWSEEADLIPEPKDTPLSELMDRRANELLGKSIAVQWSGGVDSTSLLLALIKNGINKEDLVILMDENSIKEYPKLYQHLVDQKYQLKHIKDWDNCLSTVDTDIIVNGWCADQLFGSVFFYTHPEMYFLSLEDFFNKVTLVKPLSNKEKKECIEVYKQMGKDLFNVDITCACELGWMMNFSLKWDWVKYYNELYTLGSENVFKTKVFYDTDYFQSWSVNNYPVIKAGNGFEDPRFYKTALKQYCNEVFPDEDFLLHKGKEPSWNPSFNDRIDSHSNTVRIKLEDSYVKVTIPPNVNPTESQRFFTKYMK